MTTDSPSLLLPTIISRCRQLRLHAYPDSMIGAKLETLGLDSSRRAIVLRSCSGSVGMALQMAADENFWKRHDQVMADFFALKDRSEIVHISNRYKDGKEQWELLLSDVEQLIRTLMLIRLGQLDQSAASGFPAEWQKMAKDAPLEDFSALMDAVREARKLRLSQVTWQAVVERLLFKLMEEKTKWSM